jgi:hypothetical protein|tara:strand:- start:889 stop:1095 length:207 start_codon:yes stop_codon:yes gene_type:complete
MNMKQETEKDFLRLQKILRELRFLRYSYLGNKAKRKEVEKMIRTLGGWSDEMKVELDAMQKPTGDYDI